MCLSFDWETMNLELWEKFEVPNTFLGEGKKYAVWGSY